jgi:hypothetical protein
LPADTFCMGRRSVSAFSAAKSIGFRSLNSCNLRYGFAAARDTHGFPGCGAIHEFTQPRLLRLRD